MQSSTTVRHGPDSAEAALRAELSEGGIIEPKARWRSLAGGRTNLIWRIGEGATSVVCKLYLDSGGSLLFPNDADAECQALVALSGTGLAPELVESRKTSLGRCLIYKHVDGEVFSGRIECVAEVLRRLHSRPLPPKIRRIQQGATAIREQTMRILKSCSSQKAKALKSLCPRAEDLHLNDAVFLHCDAVPANIIDGPAGLTLIDWQCPAVGDPTEDLAIFLSPAMQQLYRGEQLSAKMVENFLEAYGNHAVTRSYLDLKPLYHWRMAAHCLWKSERGAADYSAAIQLELEQLE